MVTILLTAGFSEIIIIIKKKMFSYCYNGQPSHVITCRITIRDIIEDRLFCFSLAVALRHVPTVLLINELTD